MPSFAADSDPFVLIPEAESDQWVEYVDELGDPKKTSGKFFDVYNEKASDLDGDLGAQVASGIFNWDSIIWLLRKVVTFIANAALVVGAAMIIYAGYLYVASVFSGDNT